MLPVILPTYTVRPLAFYLAEEEWLATQRRGEDFFFVWQVEPSVIVGRNQLISTEIDEDFCHNHGVRIFRRKSGGGAVVADMNNLMLSLVTTVRPGETVADTFRRYTSTVTRSLRELGLDASDNARNDILIGDRKVSGSCYYSLPGGRCVVHGTMLYDCDPELMAGVLTPPASKLRSHGVASVSSRVTTVRSHLPNLNLADFRSHLLATIPDGEALRLTDEDVKGIEEIEKAYYHPEWLNGRNPKGELRATGRIDGVGQMEVYMTLRHGLIDTLELRGDFLDRGDAGTRLQEALHGVAFTPQSVNDALEGQDIGDIIEGLTPRAFTRHLFRQ